MFVKNRERRGEGVLEACPCVCANARLRTRSTRSKTNDAEEKKEYCVFS